MVDELRVIGNVELRAAGEPVELPPQLAKALAVLVAAMVAGRTGQAVTRSDLTDALWPSAAPDADRLSAVISKLRSALGKVGLTISAARGQAGYTLRGVGVEGVEPATLLDVTAVGELVERGECLLEKARPVEAARVLADAAARWRGAPFTVGDDWALPQVCRAAVDRLDVLHRRLAKAWVRAGLLTGERAVLDWIDDDKDLVVALEGDREVWLLRFVGALAVGEPIDAETLLEERRPQWGYTDPMIMRGAQLLELHERGAEIAQPVRAAGQPGSHRGALAEFVAAVPDADAAELRLVGPTGPARTALLDELIALADAAGARVVYAICDGADDLAPGRSLMRDLWAIALTDPQFPPDSHRKVLTEIVASPRPSGIGGGQSGARLMDAAVALVAALARSRPVLVVIDDAHLLTGLAVGMTEQIRLRLAGSAAGFVLAGADSGPYAERAAGTVLAVPDGSGPARPDAGGWLAAAAVTADDLVIDPVAVAAVLGVPAARADAGLAAAVRSGVVLPGDPPRFAGPQPRAEVLAELATDPGRSRRLHGAAYRHLAGRRGADPAVLARHALAGRPDIDDHTVAAACLAAVRAELAARRFDSAIELAVRGLALTDDPELRFELQIAHGDARYDRADVHAAQTSYRAAYDEAGDSPRRRGLAAARLAHRYTDPGRVDSWLTQMLRTTREALAGATDRTSRELSLQLSGYLAHYTTMGLLPSDIADQRYDGVELARRTLAELPADATPEVACEVLSECRYALFDYVPPAELRTLSARLEEFSAASVPLRLRADALVQSTVDHMRLGDMVAAHRTSELHRALAEGLDGGMPPWQQLSMDTVFDLWDGDLTAAEARILGPQRDFLDARPREISDSMQQTWMGQLSWLRYQQGRMPELFGMLRLAERRQYFVLWAPAIALLWGETEQPAAAVDQLAATLDLTHDLRSLPPHGLAVPTLAVAAEAINSLHGFRNDRLDVDDLARRIDTELEPHTDEIALGGWPTLLVGPVHRARGLLALAVGEIDRALEHFEQGIRQVGGSAGQLAWLRLHQGRALLARDRPGDVLRAREALEAALDTANGKEIGALAAACRRELAAAAAR